MFWLYGLTELLVFDYDTIVRSMLPDSLNWVASFTIIPIVAWLALLALIVGPKLMLVYAAYLVAFPLILLFWKLPAMLWAIGSWNLGIAILNTILGAFSDIRYKLLSFCAYSIATIGIIANSDRQFPLFFLSILIAAAVASYVRASINAFRSPGAFGLYRKIFNFTANMYGEPEESKFGPRGIHLADMPENNLSTYVENLQQRVLMSEGNKLMAIRLQDYQRSHLTVASGIMSVASLLFMTLVVFSVAFYGAYKIEPSSISFSDAPSHFDFILISFSNLLFGEMPYAELVGWLPLTLAMTERVFSVSIVGIFLTILFNVRSKKYEAELQETIDTASQAGKNTELAIVQYHGYNSMDEAVEDLVKLEAGMASFITKLSVTNSARRK